MGLSPALALKLGQTTPKRATGERMETQRSTQFMLKKKKVKRRRSIDDLHLNFTSSPSLGSVSDRSPPNAAGSASWLGSGWASDRWANWASRAARARGRQWDGG